MENPTVGFIEIAGVERPVGRVEPCPWCGGLDLRIIRCEESSETGVIACGDCYACGPHRTPREAAMGKTFEEMWNDRVGPDLDPGGEWVAGRLRRDGDPPDEEFTGGVV